MCGARAEGQGHGGSSTAGPRVPSLRRGRPADGWGRSGWYSVVRRRDRAPCSCGAVRVLDGSHPARGAAHATLRCAPIGRPATSAGDRRTQNYTRGSPPTVPARCDVRKHRPHDESWDVPPVVVAPPPRRAHHVVVLPRTFPRSSTTGRTSSTSRPQLVHRWSSAPRARSAPRSRALRTSRPGTNPTDPAGVDRPWHVTTARHNGRTARTSADEGRLR